ncbi:MAG: hypothetical protein JXQ73_07765, partial [Phycisphaerae bacterium]|nr:hypothetical protein [Phycisphaerae bacterium]
MVDSSTTRRLMACLFLVCVCSASRPAAGQAVSARWIWSDGNDPAPKNRFTYFRKAFDLKELPEDGTLRFAADSNARLWINGHIVRRKVARYHEERITAEVVS